MRTVVRTVDQFKLDAHRNGAPIDYEEAFEALASLPAARRVRQPKPGKAVALELGKQVRNGRWHLIFLRGTQDEIPVLLDATSGRSEVQELDENKFVAYRTHVVVSLGERRHTLIEYSHFGAKVGEIAWLITELLGSVDGFTGVEVSFKPRTRRSFSNEVERFRRIVEASATISMPNPGWGDDAEGILNDLGAKTGAHRIGIHATAGEGESLNKNDGLVKEITKQSEKENAVIESAYVVGRRAGEAKDVRVSFLNFVKGFALKVQRQGRASVDSQELLTKMDEQATYLDEES